LFQNTFDKAKFLVNEALLEDEKGNLKDALVLYGDATELCLEAVSSIIDQVLIINYDNCFLAILFSFD